VFGYLSAARDRAKEPPPETTKVSKVATDPVEEMTAPEAPAGEA